MAANMLSVSQAILAAKGSVSSLGALTVVGEVTGFRGPNARSGHCYFQVKDDSSAFDVIVWRGVYAASGVRLADGMQVMLVGTFDVYTATGRLSFVAKRLSVAGEGLLRQQVANLARRLEREGLMDESRKRAIPRFCERVAVVTSLSGSVLDDVKRTLARRNPLVVLQVAGCSVQGPDAPATIMRALDVAAAAHPDAILLVRGGGSFEDLMTFNDEALARAVAACPVPVVTGIGHEPDTSICDMVADRRCSTPTAAAESVAPALSEVIEQIDARQQRLVTALWTQLERAGVSTGALGDRMLRATRVGIKQRVIAVEALGSHRFLSSPTAFLDERAQALELSAERLYNALPRALAPYSRALETFDARFQRVSLHAVDSHHRACEQLSTRLQVSLRHFMLPYRAQLRQNAATLDALSPMRVLGRGYAIVHSENGCVMSDARQASVGETLRIRLCVGELSASVVETRPSLPEHAGKGLARDASSYAAIEALAVNQGSGVDVQAHTYRQGEIHESANRGQ